MCFYKHWKVQQREVGKLAVGFFFSGVCQRWTGTVHSASAAGVNLVSVLVFELMRELGTE